MMRRSQTFGLEVFHRSFQKLRKIDPKKIRGKKGTPQESDLRREHSVAHALLALSTEGVLCGLSFEERLLQGFLVFLLARRFCSHLVILAKAKCRECWRNGRCAVHAYQQMARSGSGVCCWAIFEDIQKTSSADDRNRLLSGEWRQ